MAAYRNDGESDPKYATAAWSEATDSDTSQITFSNLSRTHDIEILVTTGSAPAETAKGFPVPPGGMIYGAYLSDLDPSVTSGDRLFVRCKHDSAEYKIAHA